MRNLLKGNQEDFKNALFRSVRGNIGTMVRMMCGILRDEFPGQNKLAQDDFIDAQTGMTLLQLAVMFECKEALKYLIEFGGEELITKPRKVNYCENQTALHIAVSGASKETIELLLMNIKSRKLCEQFVNMAIVITSSNESQDARDQSLQKIARLERNRCLRLERCLDIAIWEHRLDVLQLLVAHGAKPLSRDSSGNTLLHSLVAQAAVRVEEKEYYKKAFDEVAYAIAMWNAIRNNRTTPMDMDRLGGLKECLCILNNDDLNPIAMATKLESHIFENLVNLEGITKYSQITLGNVASSYYDVTCINSSVKAHMASSAPYIYNKKSCLHIVAHIPAHLNKHKDEVDIVDMEPIRSLIKTKWKFYRWFYLAWCLLHTVYMSLFTFYAFQVDDASSSAMRVTEPLNVSFDNGNTSSAKPSAFTQKSARGYWYVLFLILPTVYLTFEIKDISMNIGTWTIKKFREETSLTGNFVYRLGCILFSVSVPVWLVFFFFRDLHHDISVAMVMLLGWLFVLFFTRPIKRIGIFSIMMQRMLYNDLLPFMLISSVVLLSFTFAMHAMVLNNQNVMENESFGGTLYSMFKVIIDLDDKQTYSVASSPVFAKFLLSVYGLMLVILLVNMLIATMNTSYDVIKNTKCNLLLRQQASLILMMERRLPRCVVARSERVIMRKGAHSEKQYLYVSSAK